MPTGGGLLCGASGLGLLLAATATHAWLQRRAPGGTASLGLWRVCLGGHCRPLPDSPALWEATRALMLLSVLTAAAGLALGFSVMASAARRARARVAGVTLLLAGLLALLGLALYTAGTLSLLGPARTAWRFSWSYILGWVAVVLVSSAALWEATRALMLLSVLMAAAGLALGFSVMASAARRARARVAGVTLLLAGLLALLGLALYTAGTLSLLGPARTAWRFSWSYILGWVAVVLVSSAGLFHLCAAAKDPSPESSEVASA